MSRSNYHYRKNSSMNAIMTRMVFVLLTVPVLAVAFDDKEYVSFESEKNVDQDLRDHYCTEDSCPSDASAAISDEEILKSLTTSQRTIFDTADEMEERFEKQTTLGVPKFARPKKTNEGADNIIAHYPHFKDIIVNKIKPVMLPGTYDSLILSIGCCYEFQFKGVFKYWNNLSGKTRRIVHLKKLNKPMYQFIYHGLCAHAGDDDDDDDDNDENKHCLQGYVTTMLLVHDDEQGSVAFEPFQIPGFCKCYNNKA